MTFLVGVNQTGVARGNATVNGLPESFLNITLDGVSNQDTFNKSTDGFFAPVRPRQDAIEAVTVTSAAGGADVGGHGAVSINFVTRSGHEPVHAAAPTSTTATRAEHELLVQQARRPAQERRAAQSVRHRQGGPIVIPGLYDGRGKAFFFVHYEELRLPNDVSRVRTVLHPRAMDGWFRYNVTVGGQQVDARSQRAGPGAGQRPVRVDRSDRDAHAATISARRTQTTGAIAAATDPLLNSYFWLTPANQVEHQPAVRIDYNISERTG